MDSLPKEITIGDKYGPAMNMRSQEEADEYFEICVLHSMENFGKTREEAEKLERTNLGYYAGYYSQETSERVQRLFNCSHPVFGKVDKFPTPEEAFEMGMRWGKNQKTPQEESSMKLVKPFSSFLACGTLRECWSMALRDPGYWLLWVILAAIVYFTFSMIA